MGNAESACAWNEHIPPVALRLCICVSACMSRVRVQSTLQQQAPSIRGFAKGWFPKGWFRRMFPRNENRNEGTFAKTTLLETALLSPSDPFWWFRKRVVSKRVVSADVPPERKPERGHGSPKTTLLRNRPSLSPSDQWERTVEAAPPKLILSEPHEHLWTQRTTALPQKCCQRPAHGLFIIAGVLMPTPEKLQTPEEGLLGKKHEGQRWPEGTTSL